MPHSYPVFKLSEVLTAEQRNFFEENGYIHFKDFLKPETVDLLVRASKEVEANWLKRGLKKINGVPIKFGKDLDGSEIVQRFAFINHHSPIFAELLRDPRLKILLALIGPDARIAEDEKDGIVFNHYVNGPESKFTQMGWHVDGLRDIFYGTKLNPMLNVGIHLNNLGPEHGGLRIIPGTHKQGLFSLFFRKKHFIDHDEEPEEVSIIPKAGDLTIHDGRLWHRVAKSQVAGEESRRRVLYFPIITGKYSPKNENSPTVFYQRFAALVN